MPTSDPGNKADRATPARRPCAPHRPGGRTGLQRRRRPAGFTLIELLIVVALTAIVSGLISLAIRDPDASQLDQEAVRLVALLESARAEARASGLAARWEPVVRETGQETNDQFRFIGLPDGEARPSRWLNDAVTAQVIGARALMLGPEPIIPAQRLVIALNARQLILATDGLGPFRIVSADELAR